MRHAESQRRLPEWIDDCAEAGLNAIHIWSFVAPRQTRDGKVIEKRYGYLYPGVTPWARRRDGPAARDGWRQWDLCQFDEGDDPNQHYWPRIRDICRYAKDRQILVGITVFFGWPKHNPADWSYHPLNLLNGGHLIDRRPIVQAVQQIATPGTEMLDQSWSDAWQETQKTQWLWEQFAARLLEETQPLGNTFHMFMDERSYSEGNGGDHFANFFRRRKAFWVDGELRRSKVDAVIDGHGPGRDINNIAQKSWSRWPPRPFFELELPPYQGNAVRHNLYACLLGGGHYFFHNDEGQETPQTGIMFYDPQVKGSQGESVRERLRWLGIACQLLNTRVRQRRGMEPHNEVLRDTDGYCLARPGEEYVIYVRSGDTVSMQAPGVATDCDVVLISPRTGADRAADVKTVGRELRVDLPDADDWIILVQRN